MDAAREARTRVWAVRKGGAFRAEAGQVIAKHASRKDRQGHFVNDRTPRRKPKSAKGDSRQMGFEF
jgi:deoxyribodipyrimidine photo-lyase